MGFLQNFLLGIRRGDKWYQRALYRTAKGARNFRLPFARFFGAIFFNERRARLTAWRRFKQFFYYEPMFRYRCERVGRGLYIELNMPLILGYGTVRVGDYCRISGNVNFVVSYKVNPNPTIEIGNDVYIGYRSVFSCAEKITVGSRVLMAEGVHIYDNNNHPLDPAARATNQPVEPSGIGPVVIEDDVWLGSDCAVLRGVTIGRGSVVATHAVVTRDVPPMTVVAGNPAREVKKIESVAPTGKVASDGERIAPPDRSQPERTDGQ
jgi:acetyltransferase-like isoleucine patch superfamily enzyme